MNILITGATGLIGTYLIPYLQKKGHQISVLTRGKEKTENGVKYFNWDVEKQSINLKCFENTDAIIHLTGANVGDKRWSKSRKIEIINSRVKSAELLLNALKEINHQVRIFISASGVGIYGNTYGEMVDANSPFANDFLADVCKQWENSVKPVKDLGIKLNIFRIGIVFTPKGGALEKFTMPLKFRINPLIAGGNQYMPYIQIENLCELFNQALEGNIEGTINAVEGNITQKNLMENEAKKRNINFKINVNVPLFILKMALGEMAEITAYSVRVKPYNF